MQPKNSATDAAVLYETTGYLAETSDLDLWKNYFDCEEIDKKKAMQVSARTNE